MNELVLIDMMSELNPELLEDDYIEKDMKRGVKSFFKYIFPFKSKKTYEFPMDHSPTDEIGKPSVELNNNSDINTEIEQLSASQVNEVLELEDNETNEMNDRGFSISIFERKFRNLIKIASGVAATSLVVIGIVVIIIRRNKSGIKVVKKKVQIIY
ncbi:MAG: hypothetical protein K0S41_441 [Anaerocolumna sp.]|jgi:hypothetical protein|nr:hypothetical protein [Anaerocolumna sp.]